MLATPTNGISDLLVGSFTGSARIVPGSPERACDDAHRDIYRGRDDHRFVRPWQCAFIGDIDDDGMEDLAVSDRGTSAHIYIYKGRQTWPPALVNTRRQLRHHRDSTFDGSIFGASMARLGDFNGDGVDDFAIGANLFGGATQAGRVVIVLGKVGFATFALPNAANTIVIDGDPAVTTPQIRLIAFWALGTSTAGPCTTLVASAPGRLSVGQREPRPPLRLSRAKRLRGRDLERNRRSDTGWSDRHRIGAVLANLGPIINTLPSAGSGNPVERVSTPNGTRTSTVAARRPGP